LNLYIYSGIAKNIYKFSLASERAWLGWILQNLEKKGYFR